MVRILRIIFTVLVLLAFVAVIPAMAGNSAGSRVIRQGANISIGDTDLNVTGALNLDNSFRKPEITIIGWWEPSADIRSRAPTKMLQLAGRYDGNFDVTPQDFVGYTGKWYLVNPATGLAITPEVFTVVDPGPPY